MRWEGRWSATESVAALWSGAVADGWMDGWQWATGCRQRIAARWCTDGHWMAHKHPESRD